MSDLFMNYLARIESAKKAGKLDEAWRLANEGLTKIPGGDNYMMYYQMSLIRRKEKSYLDSLLLMGFVIYFLKRLGGMSHENHVRFLLKKLEREDYFDSFVEAAQKTPPQQLRETLKGLLDL